MAEAELLSIEKLLQQQESFTGTSSSSFQNPNYSSHQSQKNNHKSKDDGNLGFQLDFPSLKPWKNPAILKGTINFSSDSSTIKSLVFTDHIANPVPCAVIDFDPSAIRRKIEVISWNFLKTADAKGFLEIINLRRSGDDDNNEEANPSLPSSHYSSENALIATPKRKSRKENVTICGKFHSMSAPFVLPCQQQNGHGHPSAKVSSNVLEKEKNLQGVSENSAITEDIENSCRKKQRVSESSAEASKPKAVEDLVPGFLIQLKGCTHGPAQGSRRCSGECVYVVDSEFVYFTGSVCAWRPVLDTLLGKCIEVTELTKKIMVVGEERKPCSVYIATRKTIVNLSWVEKECAMAKEGRANLIKKRSCFRKGKHAEEAVKEDSSTRVRSLKKSNCVSKDELVKENVTEDASTRVSSSLKRSNCVRKDKLVNKNVSKRRSPKLKLGCCQGNVTGSFVGVVTEIYMQGSLLRLDNSVWVLLTHQPLAQIQGLRVGVILALTHFHFMEIKSSWDRNLLLGGCVYSHVAVKHFSPLASPLKVKPPPKSLLSRHIESLSFTYGFWALLVTACFKQKFSSTFSDLEIAGSKRNEGIVQKYIRPRLSSFTVLRRDITKEFFKHDSSCPMGRSDQVLLPLIVPIKNFCMQIEWMWIDKSSVLWRMDTLTNYNIDPGLSTKERYSQKSIGHFVRRNISSKYFNVILIGILQVSETSGNLQLADATGYIDVIIPDCVNYSSLELCYEVKDYVVVVEGFCDQPCPTMERKCMKPISFAGLMDGLLSKTKSSAATYYVHFYLRNSVVLEMPKMPYVCVNMDIGTMIKESKEIMSLSILFVTHKYAASTKSIDAAHCFAEAIVLPYCISIDNFDSGVWQIEKCTTTCGDENLHPIAECSCKLSGPEPNIFCLFSVNSMFKDGFLRGRFCNLNVNSNSDILDYTPLRKVLLEFTGQCISHYQLLQIGNCYLIQNSGGQLPSTRNNKISVSSKIPIWSLSLDSIHNTVPRKIYRSYTACHDNFDTQAFFRDCLFNEFDHLDLYEIEELNCMGGCHSISTPDILTDVIVYLPCNRLHQLLEFIKYLLQKEFPFIGHENAQSGKKLPDKLMAKVQEEHVSSEHIEESLNEVNLPEGELLSFSGVVRDVFCGDPNQHHDRIMYGKKQLECSSQVEKIIYRFAENASFVVDIEGPDSLWKVKLCNSCIKTVLPVGFGPGVSALFYRVLSQRLKGEKIFSLVPSSFVVIKTTRPLHISSDGQAETMHQPPMNIALVANSSTLICHLSRLSPKDRFQLRCKVVSVEKIVLEWKPGNSDATCILSNGVLKPIQISFGHFILDDGSGLCRCHCKGVEAAYLFGFHLIAGENVDNLRRKSKYSKQTKSIKNIAQLLRNLVKKHRQIIVQKNCAVVSPRTEHTILKISNMDLNTQEQWLISYLLLRACNSPTLVVSGNILNPSSQQAASLEVGEKYVMVDENFSTFTECRTVWATEVAPVCYIQEVGKLYEFLDSKL